MTATASNRWPRLLGAVALLGALAVLAAPYLTLYQIQDAAARGDGDALSEHIDFPSLRTSLKEQIRAAYVQENFTRNRSKRDGWAAVGKAIGGAFLTVMADNLIDAAVTPANMVNLLAGDRPERSDTQSGDSSRAGAPAILSPTSTEYVSLDKFVAVLTHDGKQQKLVLRRQGLRWKLTEIVIPLDDLTEAFR